MYVTLVNLFFVALILLGLSSQAQAAVAPQLLINDALKECQVYGPNAREDVINVWHNSGVNYADFHNAPEVYCNSLGYTLTQDEKVAEVKPIFKTVAIIFWIIFAAFICLYYFIFIHKKKRYIIFIILLLATAFILYVVVYSFVIYQISPCASNWAIC